ncbi:DNA-packaging protein [Brevibacillus laterosporus]|uniref:DNA-packaging protein n=1 Tax=Brevibacillus laterosporus TaxID=1465 RepID=UPI00215CFD14|nr:DNA-packaging protein [Brevibacillus laterosporus]MCR8994641.1 DNA-packaging protein [Brevibacillus laterosporus]
MSNNKQNIKSFEQMQGDWKRYLSLFRSYPDLFIDFILPKDSMFKLFFYQRMILRIMFRYRKTYFTLTRGSSKSFLQVLAKYIECILYPNIKIMITAPQKQMASQIAQQNIEEIWKYIPLLKNELRQIRFEKDYTRLIFHNGSVLDVVANSESSRGLRRHGLSVEEIIHERFDEENFNTVLLPIMANNRRPACGEEDPYELHKKITVVTTAGTKQSFAFNLLKEYLYDMISGKSAYVLGAGYELATSFGLLSLDYINDLKESPNFNPISFLREYGSTWSGSSENSLVDLETFRKARVIKNAEEKAVSDKNIEYVLSYDVARSEGNANAQSALVVIKLIPKGDGTYSKHVVNVYTFEGTHFREQALFLKQKVNDFRARVLVVDANGLGKGLIDQLVLEIDSNPPYEVINDDRYAKFKTANSIPMIFAIMSQSKETNASDIHNLFIRWIGNSQVKFLESESQAKARFKNKDDSKLIEYLRPYMMTDFLQEEVMNLEYKQSGHRTEVKQVSKSIQKDRFSALEYGLFWVYLEEQRNKTMREENIGDIESFFMGRGIKRLF